MTYKKLLKQLRETLDIYQTAYDQEWGEVSLLMRDMQFGLCHRWEFHNPKLYDLMNRIKLYDIVVKKFKSGYIGDKESCLSRKSIRLRIVFLKTFIDEIEKNMK